MSQATASLPSTRRAPARRMSPHLEALPQASRRARPKLFYAAVAVSTVMTIVVVQLLLSIGVSQGAYRIESLQSTKATLARQYQQVSEKVQTLSSPQNLAANAVALGMVSDASPVYLRLSDGAVIGSPTPASASADSTGQLVQNALTDGIPLVTAPKDAKKKDTSTASTTDGTDAASGAQASGTQASGTQASGTADSATPTSNQQSPDDSPVPWTGALPAPSTH